MVCLCNILCLIVMDITSLHKLTGLNLMLAVLVFSDRAAPPAGLSCIYRINLGPVTLSSEVLNLNRLKKSRVWCLLFLLRARGVAQGSVLGPLSL